ncbi:MAG: N-acetylglucosamine-6-phosphate deacetylase [Bacillota bacterium]|nr:N-acetylglucosamine-6-phosphate deacetylase [Bacillota bacterium]
MLIKNVNIVFLDRIKKGSVTVSDSKIKGINIESSDDNEIIDGKGMYLAPGFIDIHIHGAGGSDTMDGTYLSINTISKTILKHGTTSFVPTTMTCDILDINKAVLSIKEAIEKGTDGAEVLGAHLEGPFVSPKMLGAQNPKYVKSPSIECFEKITGDNISLIKSVTLAPEINGAEKLIKYLSSKNIVVSAGHSAASFNETMKSIEYGISHSTHLYNVMTGFKHREPGVVGAVFDSDITTELICDGIHVSYPSIRIALKQKSTNNVILITDAMSACCMEDGLYSLGGQSVIVKNNTAMLKNGSLAGSVLTLDKSVKNLYENTNYKLNEIIKMVTYNPAKHCKVHNRKGIIKEGYDADLVLFDENINIKMSVVNGEVKYVNI